MGRRSFCRIWAAPSCCRTSRLSSSCRRYLIRSLTLSGDAEPSVPCHPLSLQPPPHPVPTYPGSRAPGGTRHLPGSPGRCRWPGARSSSCTSPCSAGLLLTVPGAAWGTPGLGLSLPPPVLDYPGTAQPAGTGVPSTDGPPRPCPPPRYRPPLIPQRPPGPGTARIPPPGAGAPQ